MQWSEFSFMIQPSPLGGVGIFAIHDIPAGARLFSPNFEPRRMKVKDIPAPLLKYCIYINDEECFCPERFDRMEIGWYINHSDTPNIAKKYTATDTESVKNIREGAVYAVRDIQAGDEILIDYNYLSEPEHLKEDYYRPKQ